MIGGPSDVVIEQNIVRAVPVAAVRDREASAGSRGDAPRLPEIAPPPRVEGPAWPLQPEPVQRHEPEPATRPSRAPRVPEPEPAPTMRPLRTVEPEPMRAARVAEPEPMPRTARMAEAEPMPRTARLGEHETPIPRQVEPMPRAIASGEPVSRPAAPERPPFRVPVPTAKSATEPLRAIEPRQAPATQEDNLADMAQRLEAALRRPRSPNDDRAEVQVRPAPATEIAPTLRTEPTREAPRMEPAREAARVEPQRSPAADSARAGHAEPRPDARPVSPKSVLDSLEQEMASLLGRPAGKE